MAAASTKFVKNLNHDQINGPIMKVGKRTPDKRPEPRRNRANPPILAEMAATAPTIASTPIAITKHAGNHGIRLARAQPIPIAIRTALVAHPEYATTRKIGSIIQTLP